MANADVMMSFNLVTFKSFFWYFLVSAIATPLTPAPARDTALNGMLTGRLMNVANVTTLDIPVAALRLLEQAVSYVSQSNILVYFWISCCITPLILTTLVTQTELRSNDSPQELME